MEPKALMVIFLVAGCYAAPKHKSNRQALDAEGWKKYFAKVNVFVQTDTTTSQSLDGPQKSTKTTTSKTTVRKYILVEEEVHWKKAKSSCESIGAKLAEPKTEKQAKFLGGLFETGQYWIGGTCSGCSRVEEDKWDWVSGGKISLSNPMWGSYDNDKLPHDSGTPDDAFSLALARDSHSGNVLTFVNYGSDNVNFNFICELA